MKPQHPNYQPTQADGQKPTADRRISWGTGIALLYIGFVVGILTLVTMSMNQRVDLVTEDYYAEELGFQKKIDKMERANALPTPLRWEVTDAAIRISYPANFATGDLAGTVNLYCPSDNSKDIQFRVQPDAQNQQLIPLASLQPGRYLLQFDWKNGTVSYWNEGVITIQK
jgi:hypothetical protein